MSLGLLFVTSLAIGFSGAITPGPLFVACVARSARDGFWGGLSTVVGHAVLELLAVVGLSLGLGAVLVRPGVAPGISLLGGLVLIWMGYGTVRSALRGDMTLAAPEHTGTGAPGADEAAARETGERAAVGKASPRKLAGKARNLGGRAGVAGAIVTGLAATITNPYWIVWWATVGLSYLTMAAPLGAIGAGAFYVGHILSDFCWYAAVALAVAGGRRLLTGRGYKYLLAACGLLLFGLGSVFAGKGLLTLFR